VREPRARVALAQLGIELAGAGDDEGIDERGAGPEETGAARGDTVAQRAATSRRCVERPHAARHEDAAISITQPSARDEPRRAAVRRVSLGPAQLDHAAA